MQLAGPISAAARIPPPLVVPALTMAVSGWFLLFGLLGLGFLFDLIPVFLCIAFVTSLAIIVTTLQLPILLGLLAVPNSFMAVIPGVIGGFRDISLRTLAVSLSALVFLGVLTFLRGKFGGERHTLRGRIARGGPAVGALVVVVVFTLVSSLFLQSLPLQQQVAPFIPPLAAMGGPPGGAAPPGGAPPGVGGAPPVAAAALAGSSAAAPAAAAAQAAVPFSNNATGGVAMISPMLQGTPARRGAARRQAAATTPAAPTGAALPPTSQAAVPASGAGNFSTSAAAAAPPPAPKLPFWAAFPEFSTPLPATRTPVLQLAQSLFLPSFILFISLNLEHIIVARFFAHDKGYTVSKSQEMFSLGVINLVNSFFGGVPVGGGDMTRSSILGFAGANSPLNQVFASATVLVAMGPASAALRFLPQAALAALVMVSVVDQQPPQALMNTYFKLSFLDFVVFFIGLNLGIAAPSGINTLAAVGLGMAVLVLYTMLRLMFKRPRVLENADLERLYSKAGGFDDMLLDGELIAPSTLVVKVEGDMIFVNAERTRRRIVDAAYLKNSGRAVSAVDEPERAWNLAIDKYVNSIRRRRGVVGRDREGGLVFRPRLRMVVLDMSATTFVDTSALMSLELMKKQLRDWAGDAVEFRFVGVNKHLRRRFERAKWQIVDPFGPRVEVEGEEDEVRDFMFETLPQALRYVSQDLAMNGTFSQIVGALDEKGLAM